MNFKKIKTPYKSLLVVSFIFFVCLLNFSCEKFVDIKKSSSISLIQTANDCQLLLNDYVNMNIEYPSDGEASADDYYLKDADYLSSALTTVDQNIYIWSENAIRSDAQPQWQVPYHVVYLSNLVLENLDKLKGSTTQNILDDLRGQALFFRSYSFWQVAQLYAKAYTSTSADQDLGIPLRLSSDINGKSVRGTVNQTYSQIINDLQEAVGLLSPTSSVASRPNKAAAYAMLARVYLSMEDYTHAQSNVNSALQLNSQLIDYNTLDTTSSTPFIRFNKEVIFQSITTAGATLSPNSETDNLAKIDSSLVSSYATNDLRRKIFLKPNSETNAGSFRFTGNYEPTTSANFFNGLAVDELYLIRAECYARSGNITSSMDDLNKLLINRWSVGTYVNMSAATPDEALNKVLIERRKELLMRGQRWTDLRRLNKDPRFMKTLTRVVNGTKYNLPPNDLRYTLLIPAQVIATSTIQQNSR